MVIGEGTGGSWRYMDFRVEVRQQSAISYNVLHCLYWEKALFAL